MLIINHTKYRIKKNLQFAINQVFIGVITVIISCLIDYFKTKCSTKLKILKLEKMQK